MSEIPDVVVRAALSYTETTTLTEAILVLLGNVEIKRCANEFCQKEFVFQEPRSKKKPRNDAKFCSDICARRATQRIYVRRKRAKAKAKLMSGTGGAMRSETQEVR